MAIKLSPLRKIGLDDSVLFFIKWDYLVSYFLVVSVSKVILAQNEIVSFLWHKFLDNTMCDVLKSWEFRKFRIWYYVVFVRVSNFVVYCCLPLAIFVIYIVPKSGFMFISHSVACQTNVVGLEFKVFGRIVWVHYSVLVNKPNKRFQSLLC